MICIKALRPISNKLKLFQKNVSRLKQCNTRTYHWLVNFTIAITFIFTSIGKVVFFFYTQTQFSGIISIT